MYVLTMVGKCVSVIHTSISPRTASSSGLRPIDVRYDAHGSGFARSSAERCESRSQILVGFGCCGNLANGKTAGRREVRDRERPQAGTINFREKLVAKRN